MEQSENKTENLPILRNEVYQSNPLVEARKNFDLLGMKIFILGLQGLNPRLSEQDKLFDTEFKKLFIPTPKLTEVFGNTWYLHEIKAACKRMFNTTIEVDYPNGGFALYHLFRELKYVPTEGLYIWFDDLLRPYVLDLLEARGYTQIDVRTIFKLSSSYAIRLVELMLQFQNFREFKVRREITRSLKLDELRFMLNVPENAYRGRLNNFRKFVLDEPIHEINERTLYAMSYRPLKEGRRVIGFEFKMDTSRLKDVEPEIVKPSFVNDAIETLKSLGFTERIARAIFGKCLDAEDCFSRINRAQALLDRSKTPIRNRAGFLRKAIEQDWRVYGSSRQRRKNVADATDNRPVSLAEVFAPVITSLVSKRIELPAADNDEPPEKPNKYHLPQSVVQTLKEWINSGMSPKTVDMVLSTFGLTSDEFQKTFMK